jgi:hypothetical protein
MKTLFIVVSVLFLAAVSLSIFFAIHPRDDDNDEDDNDDNYD